MLIVRGQCTLLNNQNLLLERDFGNIMMAYAACWIYDAAELA